MNGTPDRILLRTAQRIRSHLFESRSSRALYLPEEVWQELQRLQTRMAIAQERRWQTAATHLHSDFTRTLTSLRFRLSQVEETLRANQCSVQIASIHSIHDDLVALDNEFDGFRCHLKEQKVSVVTEPIVLAGIFLGRFEIALEWKRIGSNTPYCIIALAPNPAASRSDVIHPHVNDDRLCEGDGQSAIRNALQEGRLFDFFMLVRQVLMTYNEGSAYVTLANWHGVTCADCGGLVSPDDSCVCVNCHSDICFECCYGCERCSSSFCSECRRSCDRCGATCCAGCLETCDTCDGSFCRRCLVEGECKICLETENPDESEETPTTSVADIEVQSVCLGETAFPA